MILHTRQRPDLAGLQLLLLRLAESIDRAVLSAQHVVFTYDRDDAAIVLANDRVIDQLRADLESEAHCLLAQQRVLLGDDLRSVTAALVLAAELRRIGDCARSIVMTVTPSLEMCGLNVTAELNQMAGSAREMLQDAIRAVITRDASTVERLRAADERMNTLERQARQILLAAMRAHTELSEAVICLLSVADNFARMAGCGVRIAERAAFVATGSWSIPRARGAISPAARQPAYDRQ